MIQQASNPYRLKTCQAQQFATPVALLGYASGGIFAGDFNGVIIRGWLDWRQQFEAKRITHGKHSTRLNPGYYANGVFRRCTRPAYEDAITPVIPQSEALYKFGTASQILLQDLNAAVPAPYPWSVDVRQDFERTADPNKEHWHHDGISLLTVILTADGAGPLLSRGKNATIHAMQSDLSIVATKETIKHNGEPAIPNWHRGPTLNENIAVNGNARRTNYVARSEPL
ncbi:MAG: hypothetical protein GC136_07145 [Alphaproteobacteria bacterium]|nr:hypothetical protein [Alphaproteobacteria bacterium]